MLDKPWDTATPSDTDVLVGWMRTAPNPQRRRSTASTNHAGTVSARAGPFPGPVQPGRRVNVGQAVQLASWDATRGGTGDGPRVTSPPPAFGARAGPRHRGRRPGPAGDPFPESGSGPHPGRRLPGQP